MNSNLQSQLKFLIEIDKLKSIVRASPIAGGVRRENSAEHSWHLAMYALVLADCAEDIDIGRVICMLLIHDIVEIDAGDTPLHGNSGHTDQEERERKAAKRIFGILPESKRTYMNDLWAEFEAAESKEAQFAKSLDRLQPLIQNVSSGGGTWKENHVTHQQVVDRYGPVIEAGSRPLWELAQQYVSRHFGAQAEQLGEQGGADQPATAPESKPEGKEEAKPESEGRSK